MNIALLFFYALAIRFFLFEMNLFSPVRQFFRDRSVLISKLLDCAFCSGFWVGLCVFAVARGWSYTLVPNALVVGYLAFFLRLSMEFMATQIEEAGAVTDGDSA